MIYSPVPNKAEVFLKHLFEPCLFKKGTFLSGRYLEVRLINKRCENVSESAVIFDINYLVNASTPLLCRKDVFLTNIYRLFVSYL